MELQIDLDCPQGFKIISTFPPHGTPNWPNWPGLFTKAIGYQKSCPRGPSNLPNYQNSHPHETSNWHEVSTRGKIFISIDAETILFPILSFRIQLFLNLSFRIRVSLFPNRSFRIHLSQFPNLSFRIRVSLFLNPIVSNQLSCFSFLICGLSFRILLFSFRITVPESPSSSVPESSVF